MSVREGAERACGAQKGAQNRDLCGPLTRPGRQLKWLLKRLRLGHRRHAGAHCRIEVILRRQRPRCPKSGRPDVPVGVRPAPWAQPGGQGAREYRSFLRAGGGDSARREFSCIVCQPVAVSSQPDEPWYAVRCLFGFPAAKKVNYEERVTIWRAGSFEEAVAMAERDAQDYAETLDAQYLGLAQSFHLFVEDRPSRAR